MFDLTIFPLSILSGREQYDLPGLLAVLAPRKAQRLRAQDLLVLYLRLVTPSGSPAAYTHAQQKEILSRLAETYFSSPGSVTAGLRATADRLNGFLLNRNLKAGQEGQTVGILTLVAAHGANLVIAHGGPTHSYVLSKDKVEHFDDGQGLRGLGLGRQAVPRFHQAAIAEGDMLVLCANPPGAWAHSLAGSPKIGLDAVRRRMVSDTSFDLQAAALRFSAGKGQVTFWRPAASKPESAVQPTEAAAPQAGAPAAPVDITAPRSGGMAPEPSPAAGETALTAGDLVPAAEPAPDSGAGTDVLDPGLSEFVTFAGEGPTSGGGAPEAPSSAEAGAPRAVFLGAAAEPAETAQASQVRPAPQPRPIRGRRGEDGGRADLQAQAGPAAPLPARGKTPAAAAPREKQPKPAPKPAGPSPLQVLGRRLAAAWQNTRPVRARIGLAVTSAAARAFPKRTEPLINLSTPALLLIAILVPVMVVTVATTVYFRAGRTEQFNIILGQAKQYADQTAGQQDPLLLKQSWTSVYNLVKEAEKYGRSDESDALKGQATTALDGLQGVQRLDFQPALNRSLGSDVNITHMIATLNQVYLLDETEGRILSLTRVTSGGYETNPYFTCSPAKAGGAIVGKLIDLAELPINNDLGAEVLGIDVSGNLVYCSSGREGFDSKTLALPDAGWGSIVGITTYGDTLYVLDPKLNAVYRYDGQKGIFEGKPHLYFDQDIPNMIDVIDLAVDQEFMYLLHADGSITTCSSGGVAYANTRCTDPTPYGDPRPGFEPAPLVFPGAQLTQVQTTQPPDPSLFALDPNSKAIYHLSQRRLNLQNIYLNKIDSDFPYPNQPATSFAVTPNRRLLIAFGGQLFIAQLP